MSKKAALGRGLGALMGDMELESGVPGTGLLEVDVNLIDINKNQPRKAFDDEKLSELSESIKQHGVIQPLVLRKQGERYLIIAGERRYRAARMAGLSKVPAVLKEVDERELLEIALIENIQREDLNPIEQAGAIATLMKEFSLNQEEAAGIIGKSRSAVANLLRLLTLPEKTMELVKTGALSEGHARSLLPLSDPALIDKVAEAVMESGMSVRQAEAYVKKLLSDAPKKAPREERSDFKYAESELSRALDTRVNLMGDGKKGKIVIEYFSKEQLDALYEWLITFKE